MKNKGKIDSIEKITEQDETPEDIDGKLRKIFTDGLEKFIKSDEFKKILKVFLLLTFVTLSNYIVTYIFEISAENKINDFKFLLSKMEIIAIAFITWLIGKNSK